MSISAIRPFDIHPVNCSDSPKNVSFQETVANVFDKRRIHLPATAFPYRANTHDFGVQIKELLFTKPNDESPEMKLTYSTTGLRIYHFANNLNDISDKEEFKLTFSNYQYCVRDLLIRLPSGLIVSPSSSENVEKASERARSRAFVQKSSAGSHTAHRFFDGQMGAGASHLNQCTQEIKKRFDHTNCLHFYMEGGNHYVATNAVGKLRLFMGEDHLAIAVNNMRLDKVFEDSKMGVVNVAGDIEKSLTEAKICEVLPEIYAQGLLAKATGCEKGLITTEEMGQVRSLEAAIERKFFWPLNLTQEQVLKSKKIVAKYLAQKEITKELMGRYFGVSKEDVHFIPQAGYHLDTFMRPGPKGSFFLQNYEFCLELLESIEQRSDQLQLNSTDMTILERYIATAGQLHREIGPLLSSAEKELQKAGFFVIPTPGLFFDSSEESAPCNVNFLNAITGWSAKTNAFYYIAAGASVGDQLGQVLMDAYRQFLESYQDGIHVYFIGYDPENPNDFSEAMGWLNRVQSQAGPHCFSLELQTCDKSS